MKYKKEDYLSFDPFDGDMDGPGDVRCESVKLVKTRKEHHCSMDPDMHTIPKGSAARFEKAIFEGKWCSWWSCVECMDKWFEEMGR